MTDNAHDKDCAIVDNLPSLGPRVRNADVEAAIKGETYTVLPNGRTTVCQLTLDNGYTVEGMSVCVDIANFNHAIGAHYARQDAVEKVRALLGFRLRDKIAREAALRPTYYVRHPDDSYSVADPQP